MNNIPTQAPNPQNFAGFVLWQKANELEKQVNLGLKPFGLNQAEMFHLISIAWLLLETQEVTQTSLAKFTGVTTMSVSKILRKLESKLLIIRQTGSDPRSKTIQITDQGMTVLMQTAPILNQINSNLNPK